MQQPDPPTTVATLCVALLATTLPAAPAAAQPCTELAPTRTMSRGPHDFPETPGSGRLWEKGDPGEPLFLRARVLDTCARPVAGARVQMLHANHEGEHEPDRWRTVLHTDERGAFEAVTVLPGYAGGLPRHIHFIISHPRHEQLITRIFFKNDPAVGAGIDDVAVVVEEIRRTDGPGWAAGYEFVLAPQR